MVLVADAGVVFEVGVEVLLRLALLPAVSELNRELESLVLGETTEDRFTRMNLDDPTSRHETTGDNDTIRTADDHWVEHVSNSLWLRHKKG